MKIHVQKYKLSLIFLFILMIIKQLAVYEVVLTTVREICGFVQILMSIA